MARPKKAITKKQIKDNEKKRKKFSKSRVSNHFLSTNPDFIAHTLDDDLIEAHRRGRTASGQELFFSLMDDKLDARCGEYYMEWTEDKVRYIWESILYRSLEMLRYASQETDLLEQELIWLQSQHFDDICAFLGLDPTAIRIEIPSILSKYNKIEIHGYCVTVGLSECARSIVNDFILLKELTVSGVIPSSLSEQYAHLTETLI